jgi:photosystem II stability/assembly factor-like uncharacterized protein
MLARSMRLGLMVWAMMLPSAAAASAASLWTPVSTGTTETITAVAVPSSSEIVFATAGGSIYYFNGTGFSPAGFSPSPPALGLSGIGMSTDGTRGVAVGQDGEIYYSADSGHTWTKSTAGSEYGGTCSDQSGSAPLTDLLYSATFVPSSSSAVYVTGQNGDVLKSTDGGHIFTEVNKNGTICIADPHQEFTDSFWVSASLGFFISDYFGPVFRTTDGFAGTAGGTTKISNGNGAVNGYSAPDHIAVDTANTNDQWAQGSATDDGLAYSTDGGVDWNNVNYENGAVQSDQLNDLAASGTTVVAVGANGEIWTSPDGKNLYEQVAPAPDTANNWNAVAMVPGTNTAIVGGDNGQLLITSKANQLPDKTPPTGTVSGPKTLAPGQFGSYHVSASDNPGGSGVNTASFAWSIPGETGQKGASASFAFAKAGTYTVTASFADLAGNEASASITITVKAAAPTGSGQRKTTTGGATVGIYQKLTVHGSKGRYIPVNLKAKKRRRFVIELLSNKKRHPKLLSRMSVSLQGSATVHLGIGKNVGSGTYVLEVKIYTTGKHAKEVGKRIKQVFILK